MKRRFTLPNVAPQGVLPGISRFLNKALLLTFLVAGLAIITGRAWGQEFNTPGFYNVTIPVGATVTVTVWGGGASGGCGGAAQGGGGGGAFSQSSWVESSGGTYSLYVGAGGVEADAGTAGVAGEDSYFDNGGSHPMNADGGKTTATATGGLGGSAGSSSGDFVYSGGNGGDGGGVGGGGGGGGGSALTTGDGTVGSNASGATGGAGGSGTGDGGDGCNNGVDIGVINNGTAPGGGGGGEADSDASGDGHPPGAGANGRVEVQFTGDCITHTITLNFGGTASQTICENTEIEDISYTFGGSATGASQTGLPTGLDFTVTPPIAVISQSSFLAAGTYTYTITTTPDNCGAVATATGTITVNATPVLTPAGPLVICEGDAGTVTSNTGGTWTSTDPTIVDVTPDGDYTGVLAGGPVGLIFTDANTGCQNGISVTVMPAATLTLTSANDDQVVCEGSPIVDIIYAFGGGATTPSVTFDPALTGLSGTISGTEFIISGTPVSATPGITNTYTVTTDDPAGPCGPVSLTGSVTVMPAATLTLTTDVADPVCQWTDVNIVWTVGGGATNVETLTFDPADVGLAGVMSGTEFIISGSVSESATYTVTTNDPDGPCPAVSLTGIINVTPAATIILTSAPGTDDQHICLGDAIIPITYYIDGSVRNSDGGDGVNVEGIPTGDYVVVTESTGFLLTITGAPLVSTTYTVTTIGADDPCDEVTVSGTITVHTPGTLTLTSAAGTDAQEFCIGESLTDITYEIGGGASGAVVTGLPAGVVSDVTSGVVTISGTPTGAGVSTYTVTTTGATPCAEATMTGTITVNPLPVATASSNSEVCEGTTLELYGGTASMTYSWEGPDTFSSTLQNPTIPNVTLAAAGTYTLTVTDPITLCVNTATTTVVVNALPDVTADSNSEVCEGSTLELYGGSTTTVTWSWEGPDTFSSTLQNPTIPGVTLAAAGTYTLTVTDLNGCSNIATTEVIVNPLPVPTITGNAIVCSSSEEVYFTESGVSSYTWTVDGESSYAGDGTETITVTWGPAGTGTVTVNYTDLNGCTAATPTVLPVTIIPEATITLTSAPGTDQQTICLGSDIETITYTVDGGAGGAVVDGLTPDLHYEVTGTYDVVIYGSTVTDVLYTIRTLGAVSPCPNITATGTITVNMPPTVALVSGNDGQVVCAGTAIAPMTYAIGGDAGGVDLIEGVTGLTGTVSGTTFIVSGTPVASGTFTVTTIDSDPCDEAWVTGSVTVMPPATLTLTTANDIQEICIGNPIDDIHYTFGGGATNATVEFCADLFGLTGTVSGTELIISGSPVAPTPAGTHTYTVTTNDPSGPCPAVSLSGQVTVRLAAILVNTSGNNNQTVCEDYAVDPIIYTFGAGATGATVTFDPADFGLTGTVSGTEFIITGTPDGSGTYTVTTTGSLAPCMETSLTGTVTVTPAATISLTSYTGSDHQHICLGDDIDPITYDVNGSIRPTDPGDGVDVDGLQPGLTYTFTSNLPPATGYTLTIFGSTATDVLYSITTIGADDPCPEITVTGTITVHTPGTLALTSAAGTDAQAICLGDAIGTITYTLGGGATGATVSVLPANLTSLVTGGVVTISGTPAAAGTITYTVTTTGATPCAEATMTGTITVNPLPVATATSNSPVCLGSTLQFTGGPAGMSYSWVGPNGFASTDQNPAIADVTLAAAGTYTLTVTNPATQCVNTATTAVVVNLLPEVTASSNSPVCAGSTLNLYGGPAGMTTYAWTGPNLFTSAVQNPTIAGVTLAAAGTYTLTVTDANSCMNTATTTVTVNPLPVPTITGLPTVCAFTNADYYTETGMTGYQWGVVGGEIIAGGGTRSITVLWGGSLAVGSVSVTYTNGNGCTPATPTVLPVTINLPSTITLTSAVGTDNQKICLGQNIVPITYLVDAGATGLDVIGLEPGLDFDIETGLAGITITITGTATGAMTAGGYGLVTYTITTDGSLSPCTEVLAIGTITVNRIPQFTVCPANIDDIDDPGLCSALETYEAVAVGSADLTYSYSFYSIAGGTVTGTGTGSGSAFATGTTTVTITATNSCGTATCIFAITVKDTQMPHLTPCGTPYSHATDPGSPTYLVTDAAWDAVGSDNCLFTVTNSKVAGSTLSGTTFPIGLTNVVWTITDASGNAVSCTSAITITDSELPVIACKITGTITVTSDPGWCTYTVKGVEFDFASASDNSGIYTTWYRINSGSWVQASSLVGYHFQSGSTLVTWGVKDPSNNWAYCSFTVLVTDNQLPTFDACGETFCITLKPTITRNRFGVFISATGYLYDSMIRPHAHDNCTLPASLIITYSRSTTFTDADAGANLVQVTVMDAAGNTATCCIIVDVPLPFEKSGQIGANGVVSEDVYSDLNLTVYPNPTTGKVYLDIQNLNNPKVMTRVYNMAGAMVYEKQFTTDRLIEIDLSGKVSGMYMLQVTADDRQFTHKIILDNR